MDVNKVYLGDSVSVLSSFSDECIDCCVTSPPYYGLRDYGVDGQIGLEESPEEYISKLVGLFREVRRVLKNDGTLWVNIGDSYAGNCSRSSTGRAGFGAEREGIYARGGVGLKPKDLIGIPWMLAFALRGDGWYLRQDIIWAKPNPLPGSMKDRCTSSHEYIFLLSKSQKYYFDYDAIQEPAVTASIGEKSPRFGGSKYGDSEHGGAVYSGKEYKPRTKNCMDDGQSPHSMHIRREMGIPDEKYVVRNKRDVWTVPVKPTKEAHFATYPPKLITPCILAGCRRGG